MLDKITPLVITFNEAENILRTIPKLTWARRIVVVDSGSSDGTLEILQRVSQIQVLHRKFDNFAAQCNFGLSHIDTDWVLSLDADYELSDELIRELSKLVPNDDVDGFMVRFVYRIFGKDLSGSLYPPRIVLYRRVRAVYENEGHGHKVRIQGKTVNLHGHIFHDDRKPLSRWFASQQSYAKYETDHLLEHKATLIKASDKLRLSTWMPVVLILPYLYFVKGCWRDGRHGWYYALQRLHAEAAIALEILDRRLRDKCER